MKVTKVTESLVSEHSFSIPHCHTTIEIDYFISGSGTYAVMENEKEITDTIEEIRDRLPSDDVIRELADLFKMFGDPTRAKILGCLQIRDLYVGELAETVGMSVSAVSHQLRILRAAKLVKGTKEGKEVKYSLDDDHVTKIMEYGLTHVNEDK